MAGGFSESATRCPEMETRGPEIAPYCTTNTSNTVSLGPKKVLIFTTDVYNDKVRWSYASAGHVWLENVPIPQK